MSLADTHKGWENEHLATFLLSRIAFLGAPLRVGDDIGTDLFCTLFERQTNAKGARMLLPRSSIAVQVKSSAAQFDVTARLEYLTRLEVPYYVGVVNQEVLTLTLYSARFLPLMLSYRGARYRHALKPVSELTGGYREGNEEDGFVLLCPEVMTLRATDTVDEAASRARVLHDDAAAALAAIASRLNKEYIFEAPGGAVEIFTGKDSAESFRHSFYKRLAEALLNLAWLLERGQGVSENEIEAYLGMCDALEASATLPGFAIVAKDKLNAIRNVVAP
jgi:hypothetical protein